jgi:hypothetical protein
VEHEHVASARSRRMFEGDIVVTRVARHYSLGRVNADRRTQTPVKAQEDRSDALSRACVLAGAAHGVFLHELAGPGTCIQVARSRPIAPIRKNPTK